MKITVLVDNNESKGWHSEHGLALLLEHLDGYLLFDTGDWKAVAAAALNQSERFPENYIMPGCCIQHRKCCQYQGGKNK